jgi:hypothetical protein
MNDDFEPVHCSGTVFRDFGQPNPETEELADFLRVRQARLSRFTIDRRMSMLDKLDHDVGVDVHPRRHGVHNAAVGVNR